MRILGVLGTMVWDTIWRGSDVGSPVEEWGGISYALAAADAFGPGKTRIRPLVKLGHDLAERGFRFLEELSVIEMGHDLAERGFRFLEELSVIEMDQAIMVADTPNPRVELRRSWSPIHPIRASSCAIPVRGDAPSGLRAACRRGPGRSSSRESPAAMHCM
jgi:hypothetical protein